MSWDWYKKQVQIDSLIGKVLVGIEDMEVGSDSVKFTCDDGSVFVMYHEPECCESVDINDIEGDVSDLIGLPIVVAEEVSSDDHPAPTGMFVDSYTWTFYRIATQRGYVVLRWLGESNGDYSESVYFAKIA